MKKAELREEIANLKWRVIYLQRDNARLLGKLSKLQARFAREAVLRIMDGERKTGCIPPGTKTEAPHSIMHLTKDGPVVAETGGKTNPLFTNATERPTACTFCHDWSVTEIHCKKDRDVIECPICGRAWVVIVGRLAPRDDYSQLTLTIPAMPSKRVMGVSTHRKGVSEYPGPSISVGMAEKENSDREGKNDR